MTLALLDLTMWPKRQTWEGRLKHITCNAVVQGPVSVLHGPVAVRFTPGPER